MAFTNSHYQPADRPVQTHFAIKCHPKADEVCTELDHFYATNWHFETEKAKKQFLAMDLNRWACYAYPTALDDRIKATVNVNTLLFLLDDIVENMSIDEGKAFYHRSMDLAKGEIEPNLSAPYEWIITEVWAEIRRIDAELYTEVLEEAFVCLTAQVNPIRLNVCDIKTLLALRIREGGCSFVAACVRFGSKLRISPEVRSSVERIEKSYANLGIVLNDIFSFDKELRAWTQNGKEGATILNLVNLFASDTGLSYAAAKRVCWTLCRELELVHMQLVQEREVHNDQSLMAYLDGLEFVLGGNEEWSTTTARYHERM